MTGPSVEDVIAEAIHRAGCGCTDWHPRDAEDPQYDEAAAAVVAAIRSMTVAQLAELIGGTVERSDTCAECAERGIECDRSARAVGPWGAPS